MPEPGYGPHGWYTPAVGLHSFQANRPPILHRPLPSPPPSIAIGFGRIPRRVLPEEEALRVKT